MREIPATPSARTSALTTGYLIAWRLVLLTAAMGVFVAALACLELGVLRSLGFGTRPDYWIDGAGVHGFSVSSNGRWGLSRLAYSPVGARANNRCDLLLHDLRNPHRVTQIGWPGALPRQSAVASSGDQWVMAAGAELLLCRSPWTSSLLRRLSTVADADSVQLAWSSDDQWIAAADEKAVSIWRGSGHRVHRLPYRGAPPVAIQFSADSRRLLVLGSDAAFGLWDVATGRQELTVQLDAVGLAVPAFSRDLQTAAYSSADGSLRIRTEAGVTALGREHVPSRLLKRQLAFSSDAALLAVADSLIANFASPERRLQRRIWIWNLRSGEVVQRVPSSGRDVESLYFHYPRMLYICDGKQVRGWNVAESREAWRFRCEDWMRRAGGTPDRLRL